MRNPAPAMPAKARRKIMGFASGRIFPGEAARFGASGQGSPLDINMAMGQWENDGGYVKIGYQQLVN